MGRKQNGSPKNSLENQGFGCIVGLGIGGTAAMASVLGEKASVKADGDEGKQVVLVDGPDILEAEVAMLRGRWELASVINFLTVFERVIGSDLKISAEEIELGLIKPNESLSRLHIALLKGIPPVSKTSYFSDAWITMVCKKLAMWWPWVAEGDIPLKASKGEEIHKYKELDPNHRLFILKALCEVRAEQDDIASHINVSLKEGCQISSFRKLKIGDAVANGTSYWYDGNAVLGYRLYREVTTFKPKDKVKIKERVNLPAIKFQWETLATNIDELRRATNELLSSNVTHEVTVGKTIEADALPVLEKLQKKKEMALKRKQKEEMLSNNFRNSCNAGMTRSCRNRRQVCYTFEDYDRAINEAIQISKKRKTEEQGKEDKGVDSSAEPDTATESEHDSLKGESEPESNMLKEDGCEDYDTEDDNYGDEEDDENSHGSDSANSTENENSTLHSKNSIFDDLDLRNQNSRYPVRESRNLVAKNRLRQRPTLNTALDSIVVPDSEDEKL